jgi:Zn-dependent protease
MIVAELLWTIPRGWMGVGYVAIGMGVLFLIVLLHEFGHCFACRWVGGEADQILMWPLGGLAFTAPPEGWKASFVTTAGGPLVNVLIAPVAAAGVLAAGGGIDALVFNPFNPTFALLQLTSWWGVALWWVYYLNLVLLAFNVLMPMFPLDGARMVQELLWARIGRRRSMQIAVNVGLVTAVVVGVLGLTGGESRLFGLAVFCGLTCWMERRNLQFMEDPALAGYDFERGYRGMPGAAGREEEPAAAESKREARRREREEREQADVDRILGKIAESGLASLTRGERAALHRATERKRGK